MMKQSIQHFSAQFTYEPQIERASAMKQFKRAVVIGMGGSHLAADLYRLIRPEFSLLVHSDYGLPALPLSDWSDTLVILFSYSGNTEEVLEAAQLAYEQGLNTVAIAIGGKLLAFAREHGVPGVQLPDIGIQPRMGLGFSLRALEKVLGDEAALNESRAVAALNAEDLLPIAEALTQKLIGKVPVVYASRHNQPLAYIWKIKLNETGKIPAFCNAVPELNHNEMTGFDVTPSTRVLSQSFHFIFLEDPHDYPQVKKRWAAMAKLYTDRGLPVERITLTGSTIHEKIFSALLIADWTALKLAEHYGVESEQVPMVEEFKQLIAV